MGRTDDRDSPDCPAVRRVVIRLSALGDVVLVTGVLRHWYATRGWRCVVITRAAWAEVFRGHPAVDAVIALTDSDLAGARLLARWRELAARYAGVELIDLHNTLRTRLLGLCWRGPVRRYAKQAMVRRLFLLSGGRFGGAHLRAACVTQRYALAAEPCLPNKIGPNMGESAAALAPCLYLDADEQAHGCAVCAQIPGYTEGLPVVALHPYAAHAGKTWPPARWLELAAELERHNLAWCMIGKGELIPGVAPERNLVNRLTLRESAAVLAACAALVTGDSGPMHLAAAVGTPVVALFGSTTREWGFYPTGPRDVVLERELSCRPCSLHGAHHCPRNAACLDIPCAEVVAAVCAGLLSKNERQPK